MELNLIDAAEVTSGSLLVESLNQTGSLSRVACGERAWVAKNAAGDAVPGRDWRAELAMYRVTTASADDTVVPRLVAYSQDQELILIESLDQGWQRLDSFDLPSPWSIEIFSRVATSLARWHQASRSLAGMGHAEPWPLAQLKQAPHRSTDLDALICDVLADHSLRASIRTVQQAWQRSHLIHGDLCMRHVMCHEGGSTRFLDWGASGLGDPRWDLATLLQALLCAEIEQAVDTTAHRLAVLDAYAERGQIPTQGTQDDATLRAFVAVRLIGRAMQICQSSEGTRHGIDAHLAMARDTPL